MIIVLYIVLSNAFNKGKKVYIHTGGMINSLTSYSIYEHRNTNAFNFESTT